MMFANYKYLLFLAIFSHFNFGAINSLRILGIFPYQGRSQFIIPDEVMKALAAKGHQLDVYSHFPPEKAISNYTSFSLKGTVHEYVSNLDYDTMKGLSYAQLMEHMLSITGKPLCELLEHPHFQKLLRNPPTDPPYDVVIHSVCMEYCHIAWGRYLKVPIVGIVSVPVLPWLFDSMGNPFNPAADISFLSYVPPLNFFERLSNFVNSFRIKYEFRRLAKQQDVYVQKYFGPGYPSAADLPTDYSLLLANYDPILQGVRPFLPSIVPIAGLHIIDRNETIPQNVQKWLDESNHGFIYVSFGSLLKFESFPSTAVEAMYKTFEQISPSRVLLKISNPKALPKNLPANVLTQSWLPQLQVLKHRNIKVFITHCGIMGTQESIYYGVPMICTPVFIDQLQNAEMYSRKKIAIKLDIDEITSESLTNAITEIMKNPVYKNSMRKISYQFKDRSISQLDKAVYWIEFAAQCGKDALRAPVLNLSWWQANLLDVYGFIIFLIFTGILIIKMLIIKCIQLIRRRFNLYSKIKRK